MKYKPYSFDIRSSTLDKLPERAKVVSILEAALEAVDPYEAVRRAATLEDGYLEVFGRKIDLDDYRRIYLTGGGKAAIPMGRALEDILGDRISGGLLVTKTDPGSEIHDYGLRKTRLLGASHPIPDIRSVQAGRAIMALLEPLSEDDLIICAISGGGSALITAPAGDVQLTDLQALTDQLLRSGATINEINTIRKHLDLVKGGGLLKMAAPATMVTLVLSDVIGDPLEVIASGPTVPDETTFQDCLDILDRYDLRQKTPQVILSRLIRGVEDEIPETLKPGELDLKKSFTTVIANNQLACQAALQKAKSLGFHTLYLGSFVQGEARVVGQLFASLAKQIQLSGEPLSRPACVIAGGETTVTVRGRGRGGRNQELALGGVDGLDGLERVLLVALATDGGDGPTDAAGAVVDGETRKRALSQGVSPAEFLGNNDSYTFFDTLGDLIRTGPTHTNVNDLTILFAF